MGLRRYDELLNGMGFPRTAVCVCMPGPNLRRSDDRGFRLSGTTILSPPHKFVTFVAPRLRSCRPRPTAMPPPHPPCTAGCPPILPGKVTAPLPMARFLLHKRQGRWLFAVRDRQTETHGCSTLIPSPGRKPTPCPSANSRPSWMTWWQALSARLPRYKTRNSRTGTTTRTTSNKPAQARRRPPLLPLIRYANNRTCSARLATLFRHAGESRHSVKIIHSGRRPGFLFPESIESDPNGTYFRGFRSYPIPSFRSSRRDNPESSGTRSPQTDAFAHR